jgi:folate-dependent phosphoribosylglycinamide formyltransferase PurN
MAEGLKVAILTMPGGELVVHHLVKQLNVVGIVVDMGKWGSAKKPPPRRSVLERLEWHWRREGALGTGRFLLQKLAHVEPSDSRSRAAHLEDEYLRALDAELVGHPYFVHRTDLRQFAKMDEIARFHSVPLVRVENVNDDASARALAGWAPDLGIVCGGRIVKSNIIKIPRLGLLNKHSAILPKHRGLSAEFWCLYHEDFEHLGLTVHFVEPGLDNGNIVVQKRLVFEKGDTPDSLRIKSELLGRDAMVEAVRAIEATGTRGAPQNEAEATKNPAPTAQTERELYKKLPRLWEKYGA